jgi:tRNA modification GTPase
MYDDTIAAIATAPGEAGVAVVRISGPASREVLGSIFRPTRAGRLTPRHMTFGWIVDASGERLDQVLAVVMPGPRSFSGEDVAEVHCHGGAQSPGRVLAAALAAGARLAEPGEFSLRAFLNGRIDLAQAEALLDLVQARTARAHQLALAGLAGRLSTAARAARANLQEIRAYLEACLDFPDEELPEKDVTPELAGVLAQIRELLAGAEQGIVYRQGVRLAIVGRPNVGKSSLLNALLRADRSIVSPTPGTTRDTVEECASLGGVPFWLVDTAGLREASDPVEQLGVARSRAALASADLALLVLDSAAEIESADRQLLAELAEQPLVVALNKIDLPTRFDLGQIGPAARTAPRVAVSAVRGDGLAELERVLVETALSGSVELADPAVTHPRHRAALERAETALEVALQARSGGLPPDLQAAELAAAVGALGEITGESANADLLDIIFSRFCIGK